MTRSVKCIFYFGIIDWPPTCIFLLLLQVLESKFDSETDADKKELYSRLLTKMKTAVSIAETAINNSSSKPQNAEALKDVQTVCAGFASEFL